MLKVGTQLHGYTVQRIEEIEDLQSTLTILQHESGAKHIHITRDDNNLTFCVAFPTIPEDSTGVAHILEHIVLGGSQKYDVKDPFFSMSSRSLSTFMNAMTGSDYTVYPFSSRNTKDYFNLLEVYLDAVFFPLMDEWKFKREAHRLEFAEPENANSELTIQGVVYNEMKGAMSSASSRLWKLLGKALYPDLTYAHNSGGDPKHIPELSHEGLKEFHAKHYHPSNAFFVTYGNHPLPKILATIHEQALQRFSNKNYHFDVALQDNFSTPQYAHAQYPNSETLNKTQVLLAWKTNLLTDTYLSLKMSILDSVLLGNSAAPLRKALIDSGLGASLANGSGYIAGFKEAAFGAGLQGTNPENAQTIQNLVLDTLNNIVEQGIPEEWVDSALHQIELNRKEVSNSGYPYSLKLIFSFISEWMYGGDPVEVLRFNEDLARLNAERAEGKVFERLITEQLLHNPHRVLLVLEPSATLSEEEAHAEKERIAHIARDLSPEQAAEVVRVSTTLLDMQDDLGDVDSLPKVGLDDVNITVPEVPYSTAQAGDTVLGLIPQPTNGLVYVDIQLKFSHLSLEHKRLLTMFAFALTRSGAGEMDDVELARYLEAHTGGVGAGAMVSALAHQPTSSDEDFSLSGKALKRNSTALFNVMALILKEPRFTVQRLRQLIKQQVASMEAGIVQSGHVYAARLAGSQISPVVALREQLSGLSQLATLRHYAQADDAVLENLITKFHSILAALFQAPIHIAITAEEDALNELQQLATHLFSNHSQHPKPQSTPTKTLQPIARTTDVPVAYNAKAILCVPYTHTDAAPLYVLAQILRDSYMMREIREKGGAYGGFTSYDLQGGIFAFLTYRDPHIERSFKVFDEAVEHVLSGNIDQRELEEGILQACGNLDPLSSPDTEGKSRFFGDVSGYTRDLQETLRTRLLQVSLDDLKRVAQTYLTAAGAKAVISGAERIKTANEALGNTFVVEAI